MNRRVALAGHWVVVAGLSFLGEVPIDDDVLEWFVVLVEDRKNRLFDILGRVE